MVELYLEAGLGHGQNVTRSDLSVRVARSAVRLVLRRSDLGWKQRSNSAHAFASVMLLVLAFGYPVRGRAQSAAVETGIEDTWQGNLHYPQKDMRTVVEISKTDGGLLKAVLYSIDQGGQAVSTSNVSFVGDVLKFKIESADGDYEGKISADRKSIVGTWTQGSQPMPLVFERATPETEWAIPTPPPALRPMSADANPSFEVATIKPSKTDHSGEGLRLRGARLFIDGMTLNDLIKYAYDVQDKQIIKAQPWMSTDRFDIAAQPDTPGEPGPQQLKTMVQTLLASRFQLTVHADKRDLSAYVLTVARGGPKLKQSHGDRNGLPGLLFSGPGYLTVHNATMDDFCQVMQSEVLDRPVVNQTGIEGRWDFLLKWWPDESQFGGMYAKLPPLTNPGAPPPLFTAVSEQIGLKFETKKTQVNVVIIDHVEKPSEN
jgi:uncharacterized protein (TIGR03435 family)